MGVADELFDEGGAAAPPAFLEALMTLAWEAIEAQEAVASLTEALEVASKHFNKIKTQDLPAMMAEVGVDELSVPGQAKIKIKEFVSGSLPKEPGARDLAIKWLENHDGAALIKTEVSLTFGKAEHNVANALVEELKQRQFPVESSSGVHASTLQAFARECLKNGDEIDLETLGLYAGRIADIKLINKG